MSKSEYESYLEKIPYDAMGDFQYSVRKVIRNSRQIWKIFPRKNNSLDL